MKAMVFVLMVMMMMMMTRRRCGSRHSGVCRQGVAAHAVRLHMAAIDGQHSAEQGRQVSSVSGVMIGATIHLTVAKILVARLFRMILMLRMMAIMILTMVWRFLILVTVMM